MTRLSAADFRFIEAKRNGKQSQRQPKRLKYGNTIVREDGLVFQSKREARRWQELKLEQKSGLIKNLRRQVPFSIAVNKIHVCVYRADFVYQIRGEEVVEDSKGKKTEAYILKKKLLFACHGIVIKES